MSTSITYYVGLDLGQVNDPTALAVVERRDEYHEPLCGKLTGPPSRPMYAVNYLRRWALGSPYPDIVADLAALIDTPRPRSNVYPLHGCTLGVDECGVGRGVLDIIRRANLRASLVPVLVTAGHDATPAPSGGGWHLPKKQLMSAPLALLQENRLRIKGDLPQADTLRKEFLSYSTKVSAAGSLTLEPLRSGQHDDILFATAIAVWLGENMPPRAGSLLPSYHVGQLPSQSPSYGQAERYGYGL